MEAKEVHPLALLIPEMEPDQYAELRDDIATHGLNVPIVLHEDQVLDGRHRMRACVDTDTPPRFEEFEGDSPVEFVLSMNVKRRHLTPSQRAAIAMGFLPAAEEEARKRQHAGQDRGRAVQHGHEVVPAPGSQNHEEHPRRAREDVGRMAGVSGATIDRARRVAREDPEMFEQVKAGAITVREADSVLRERNRPAENTQTNGRKPTRDGTYKRRSVDLVSNVVDRLAVMPMALREIDVSTAILEPNAPLQEWDRKLTEAIVSFSRLRSQIRKEMSK